MRCLVLPSRVSLCSHGHHPALYQLRNSRLHWPPKFSTGATPIVSRLHSIGLLVLLLPLTAAAQNRLAAEGLAARISTPPADTAVRKFTGQPYVIEQYTTRVRFDARGAETRTVTARVRIQSALAAQKFSRLAFHYDQSAEAFEFRSVQILKPDRSTRATIATASSEDAPADVTRDSPAYQSYREKSLKIPELQPGDTLDYEIAWRSAHPHPDGALWMQHAFLADAIVLQEILEVEVPKSRHVFLKSPHASYSTDATSSPNVVTYRWRHSNLDLPADDAQPSPAPQAARMKPADVSITSFAAWDEVARWYTKLSSEPNASAEVSAKAAELTQGRATQAEKTQAIYDFVSKNIRYLDLPFATAADELHSSAQVLAQGYATAADKRILLADLLAAAGIPSQTALSSAAAFDTSFPSPADFDRVLTAVQENGRTEWLDPSSGFAPFEFLPASLRNKPALLISPGGAAKISATPADPPFPSTQRVAIEGRVSALGKLTAQVRYELRGDNEYVLRLAFHRTPQTQWKELAQTMLALDGIHGEIASVTPSDPAATQSPFVLQIAYSQPDFLDWASPRQKIPIPLLALGLPDPPKNRPGAGTDAGMDLGSPLAVTAQLELTFPENFTARPPAAIAVSREYAEFHSTYQFSEGLLTARRSLDFKMRSLDSTRTADYLAFSRAVSADQAQPLLLENPAASAAAIPSTATPTELFEAGSASLASGNTRSSIPLLERAVQLQPNHPEAWNKLGLSYLRARQFALASSAFQKQIEVNPADPQARNYLGLALEQQRQNDAAIAAFRQQIALDPLDKTAREALGTLYLGEHEYALALPELDKAAVLSPEKPALQLALGEAYASLAQNDQALAAFGQAVALSRSPAVPNAVARSLADHNLDLANALKYAQSAVSAAASDLGTVDPARISAEQLSAETKLADYWDTLGWVYCQQGNLDAAERYIRAAWIWNERGDTASHLARLYEKRGQKDQAVRAYAFALAARDPDPGARARLTLLLGGNSQIPDLLDQSRPALASLHTFHLAKAAAGNSSSEVLIVLSPVPGKPASSRPSALRLSNPSEELRPVANRLSALDFGPAFADASVQKLARRGTLACSSASDECTLTLSSLDSADPAAAADTANGQ